MALPARWFGCCLFLTATERRVRAVARRRGAVTLIRRVVPVAVPRSHCALGAHPPAGGVPVTVVAERRAVTDWRGVLLKAGYRRAAVACCG